MPLQGHNVEVIAGTVNIKGCRKRKCIDIKHRKQEQEEGMILRNQ